MKPLAVDVDGTLTREDASLDPRVLDPLREWGEPVVVATGKVLPNATALCHFVGIPPYAVAETGGVVYVDGSLEVRGDGEAARAAVRDYVEGGHELGWDEADIVNRWRETEVAVNREMPLEPLERSAEKHGVEVVDTGYAYHVKSPNVSKGDGVRRAAELLGLDAGDFVAVGDSMNDVSTFQAVGEAWAVANADREARDAADHVTEAGFGEGFLEFLDAVR